MTSTIGEGWPKVFRTRRGLDILIRPLAPDDEERMVEFIGRLSPETRYRRFHIPVPDPPSEQLLRRTGELEGIPPGRGAALVALHAGIIVGSARFAHAPGQSEAEAAVVVRDDWQGQGIGTRLLAEMAVLARDQGVRVLYAYVQPDNHRILRVIRRAHFPTRVQVEQGLMRVDVLIDREEEITSNQ